MFSDVTMSYEKFRDEIYSLYPRVQCKCNFTTIDIRHLVDEQKEVKLINDINDYSLFYVKALPMLKGLLAKSRVTFTEVNAILADILDRSL